MDLKDTPIEIAIGPYEVYTDRLFGQKAAFESFVTLKDPEESAALAKYKAYLKDMEANLPVPDSYKNFKRGFESPIAVADAYVTSAAPAGNFHRGRRQMEEHTSELQSLMRISYAVFCLKKKLKKTKHTTNN